MQKSPRPSTSWEKKVIHTTMPTSSPWWKLMLHSVEQSLLCRLIWGESLIATKGCTLLPVWRCQQKCLVVFT